MAVVSKASAIIFLVLASSCAMPNDGTLQSGPEQRPPNSYHGLSQSSVLIFNGPSAWESEIDSLETSLIEHDINYQQVNSEQLQTMSLDEISAYSLLIIPGGDAPTMASSLNSASHEKLRQAVQDRGMSYLGFCAGAWLAVAPAPEPGHDVAYGIGIVDGPVEEQTPFFKQGKEFMIANASFPDGTHRDLLWYGGPITPDIPGGVVAKYPDGNPAITQIWSGKGFVIVSGLHPTANSAILNVLGLSDDQAIDPQLTWQMLQAVIEQKPLPAFS